MGRQWNEDAVSQRIHAPYKPLAIFGGSTGAPATMDFRVPAVDTRLRILIGLVFTPPGGANITTVKTALVGTASIWLFEEEEDRSGSTGIYVPCTNIEGMLASPTSIPADAGLMGYAREFVTAAKSIGGHFTAAGGPAGTWGLQVTYNPEPGAVFAPSEFNELRALCQPNLLLPTQNIP